MDEIVGIAILTDPSPHDGYEYLFVTCASPSRKTVSTAAIPVREKGQPNPDNKGWQYKIVGDYLDVTPSLKMSVPADPEKPNGEMRETFHNGGAWSVRFVRKPLDEASDALHELNAELRNRLRETYRAQ